jgi:hypothetical protein
MMALIVTACGSAFRPDAANLDSARYVRVVGHDPAGNRVEITWAPDGGDIRTTSPDGLEDEIWFRGKRVAQRNVFGSAGEYEAVSMQLLELDLDRAVLTGALNGVRPQDAQPYEGGYDGNVTLVPPNPFAKAVWYGDGTVRSSGEIYLPKFIGKYAYAWRNFQGTSFVAEQGPEAVSRFPAPPRSLWDRSSLGYGTVTASVDGHAARAILDTGEGGLAISERFADLLGVRSVDWSKAFFLPEKRTKFARLVNVVLAGKRVPVAAARIVPDNRYDLYAGVDLFPKTGFLITREGQAKTSRQRCVHGAKAIIGDTVMMSGLDPASLENVPNINPTHVALLDSTLIGPPIFFTTVMPLFGTPTIPRLDKDGRLSVPGALDCSGPNVALAFSGQLFGADGPTCYQRVFLWNEPWNVRVGLHSLDARELLIDRRDQLVCWFS